MSAGMVIRREQCLQRPSVWCSPRQGQTYNWLCHGSHERTLWHPSFEGGQWHNEGPLWPPKKLRQIPRWHDLVALPNPDWRVVSKAATTLGRPLTGFHPDQSCSLQDSVSSKMMMVLLNRLVPYLGATWDKQPWGGSNFSLTFKCRSIEMVVAWAGQNLFKCPLLLWI
jgi:hypothetical protein